MRLVAHINQQSGRDPTLLPREVQFHNYDLTDIHSANTKEIHVVGGAPFCDCTVVVALL